MSRDRHRTPKEFDLQVEMAGVEVRALVPAPRCQRAVKENEAWTRVDAIEPEAFRLTGIPGVETLALFTCRDPETEERVGASPLFIVCEHRSGFIVPTLLRSPERSVAIDAAARLFLSLEEAERRHLVDQFHGAAQERR